MIAAIKGTIIETTTTSLIIDTGGLAYEVTVPLSLLTLTREEEVFLWTELIHSETEMTLYGFSSLEQRKMFQLLVGISGIGPKMAIGVIGGGTVEEIKNALQFEDVSFFTQVSGIGKKNGQRIVLELKNKVDVSSTSGQPSHSQTPSDTVVDALLGLGYSTPEITKVLQTLDRTQSEEEQIKQALKKLS